MTKIALVVALVSALLGGCDQSSSSRGLPNAEATPTTLAEPATPKPVTDGAGAPQRECHRGIAALSRLGSPTKERAAAAELTGMCSAYCTAASPDKMRAGTCKVVSGLVAEACVTGAIDCARVCEFEHDNAYLASLACAHVALTVLHEGDKVFAKWTDGRWYPGKVTALSPDGTMDVAYDDGDKSKALPPAKVKARAIHELEQRIKKGAPSQAGGGGGRPSGGGKLVEGASCAGPGWQYVCGGRCTDTKVDNNHCGGCGRACDAGYHCDGSGTCRNASGGL